MVRTGPALTGTALTLLATGLAELAASRRNDSLLDRAGRVAVDNTPLPVVEETIRLLGTTDKPVLRAGLAGGIAAAGGWLVDRRGPRVPRWLAPLAAAGGVAALAAARHHLRAEVEDRDRAAARIPVADPLPAVTDGAEGWPHVQPLFTDPARFYVTDVNLRPPLIDRDGWRLAVAADGRGTSLSYDALMALGVRERDAVLACVHNRLGWDRLGHQRWTGIPLIEILDAAGVPVPHDPTAFDVVMTAVDGYRQVLPLTTAIAADSWVVIGMDGHALPAAHGFPARVMTPGVVGQYNGVKWLVGLELSPTGTVAATWVARGWPRETIWVRPMARTDWPGNLGMPPRLPRRTVIDAGRTSIVGTAWHPPHGIERVEVRIDGGAWTSASLADEISTSSWRRWRLDADLARGRHSLTVRCVSRDGTVQAAAPSPPFPDGVTGHHTVDFRTV